MTKESWIKGPSAKQRTRLEDEVHDTNKWEAQAPFVVAIASLALARFEPLAALQLRLEWGRDTDSSAQLVGAFVGARVVVGGGA